MTRTSYCSRVRLELSFCKLSIWLVIGKYQLCTQFSRKFHHIFFILGKDNLRSREKQAEMKHGVI